MKEIVIFSAARTPFGKFGGGLKTLKTSDLGGLARRSSTASSVNWLSSKSRKTVWSSKRSPPESPWKKSSPRPALN